MRFHDVRMRGFPSRTDVDEAVAWVDALPAPLPAESVALAAAAGRVLADAVVSALDLPPFARSAMDGWAVRGADTFGASASEPLPLALVGEVRPGAAPDVTVGPRQAARIRTGAPLPDGADAVLPAEWGAESGAPPTEVRVLEAVPPGRHVGQRGEDVARGTEVLARGRRLRPQDVALLSALGVAHVRAVRRPAVQVLVTGSEVRAAGTRPEGFAVADANGPMLDALVRRDGGVPRVRGPFADDDPALEEALVAPEADVLLVTGGSSVGPEDRVPGLVARHGTLAIHGLALRPASPAGMGVVGGRPVFLLPGNPVSALCAYDLFAGRLVRRLGGLPGALPHRRTRARLARKVVSELGRVDFLRVRLVAGDEGTRADPITSRGAGVLTSVTRADGFVLVPKDVEGYPEGHEVDVHLYD
jgi:molybdopterin molybdotransferase